jgi:hypothetical protein
MNTGRKTLVILRYETSREYNFDFQFEILKKKSLIVLNVFKASHKFQIEINYE